MVTGRNRLPRKERVAEQSQQMVSEHPLSAAVTAFGLGIGVGVVLASLLSESDRRRTPQSYGRRMGDAAEQLGRQLLDAIGAALPESLARHLPD